MQDSKFKNTPLSDKSIDFLMTDFQASVSQWQHMNDRMDKEIQYYFTLCGVAVTAVGLLLQFGTDVFIILGVTHLLALIMWFAGLRLLRRIIHLTGQSALFSAQIGLIRRAAIDIDERVSSYIILTTAFADKSAHNFTPISQQLAVRVLYIINSLLTVVMVFMVPLYFYFYFQSIYSPIIWVRVFVIVGIVSFVVGGIIMWYQRKISILRGDGYLEHITRSVQQKRTAFITTRNS